MSEKSYTVVVEQTVRRQWRVETEAETLEEAVEFAKGWAYDCPDTAQENKVTGINVVAVMEGEPDG
jgi:hypothetical protein